MNKIENLILREKTKCYVVKEYLKDKIKKFLLMEQEGIGVVEIILIIVVIIALVLLFKEQISRVIMKIFTRINGDLDSFK